jgi:hypothetical protein
MSFVCQPCLQDKYTNKPSPFCRVSHGRCEDCGCVAGCWDIKSRDLVLKSASANANECGDTE